MEIIGVLGLLIGVCSLVYAIYVNREISKLRKYQIHNLRNILKNCIVVMVQSDRLLNELEEYKITNTKAIKRITATHCFSAGMIRDLFRDLSKIDLPYDGDKLNTYVKSGIITSCWVWEQAIMFVENPDEIAVPKLPKDSDDGVEE